MNEELIYLSGDEETRKRYEKRMDTLRNERSALKSAEEKGIQKGLQKGLQQGLQKGLEQGAKQEKLEIAKKLIQNGLDNNFIIETTGLTRDEVRELRKENESK